jgi:hypothetical protein
LFLVFNGPVTPCRHGQEIPAGIESARKSVEMEPELAYDSDWNLRQNLIEQMALISCKAR